MNLHRHVKERQRTSTEMQRGNARNFVYYQLTVLEKSRQIIDTFDFRKLIVIVLVLIKFIFDES